MIISHTYKYIYIRPMKTASSSIEKYLLKYLCDRNNDEINKLKNGLAGPHLNATQIKNNMNPQKWNDYLKLVSERNPWDKVISLYYWEVKRQQPKIPINLNNIQNNKEISYKGFHDWFKMRIKPLKYEDVTQKNALSHRYYFIGDDYISDVFFVKYENLINDFSVFCGKMNHDFNINEFKKYKDKMGIRPKWAKDYRQFYIDYEIEFVGNLCKKTIELLKYKY